MSNVKAVYYSVQDVGKLVKKTKKHCVWKFSSRGQDHIIDLFASFVSGKKKLRVDGKIIYESQKVMSTAFNYDLDIDGNTINITQRGEKFEMFINSQHFEALYGGGLNGYDDVGRSKHHSHSRGDDNYGRRDNFRNNYEADEYSNRSQYNNRGSGYGDERRNNWDDVRDAASSTKNRRDYHDEEDRQGRNRDNSYEDNRMSHSQEYRGQRRNDFEGQETQYSMRHHGKAKTYSPNGDHEESRSRVEPQKTSSFNDFSDFNNFDNKENRSSNINSQNRPQEKTMDTRSQVKPNFFQLETQGSRQDPQLPTLTTSQTVNQQNFFGFGTQKEESQAPSVPPSTMQTQQAQPAANNVTLIDFATPSSNNLSILNDLYKNAPAPQVTTVDLLDQVQPQPQSQNQLQALPPSESSKKDLWQTDLVSLNSQEVANKNNNNMGNNGYNNNMQQNYNNFSTPMMGMNNMYNNQNQMQRSMTMGMNTNMNMNMGGFNGNMGMNNGNFGRMNSNMTYY